MFTGIIEALGAAAAIQHNADMRLLVASGALDMTDVQLGDSIAVNGVCLTVTEQVPGTGFWADVSRETLAHSTLGELQSGAPLNLEKALTPSTRLGGHLVSGHVDAVGRIVAIQDDGRSTRLSIEAPATLMRYIAVKGSICVDGVSLTVNSVEAALFTLNIVPHTLDQTLIKYYSVGRPVNLEVDLIARYLERLLTGAPDPEQSQQHPDDTSATLSKTFLAQHGFLR